MSIGGGIFLIVVGAILSFAVHLAVPGISLVIIGDILMLAGIVVLIFGIVAVFRRRRTTVTSVSGYDADGERVSRTERSDDLS